MSYNAPSITPVDSPPGLDGAIELLRMELENISWLDQSFGRAWPHKEEFNGKVITVPKVFTGRNRAKTGEYLNVLPNDNFKAASFISMRGPEKWETFNRSNGSMKSREVSIIIWVNLKKINPSRGYIFIDELKKDVEFVLEKNANVQAIEQYYDERVEDIFQGYSVEDVETQYLMYPYAGMRFDLTLFYPETCEEIT